MDFTLKSYAELLNSILEAGYKTMTFENYLSKNIKDSRIAILRHDVDKRPINSLLMAKLESSYEISSSYYFRILKKSNNPAIITKISSLGHEVGYHYEDLTLAKGNIEIAIQLFEKHLNYFRKFYPVKTICMHGSPLSKFDNRDIWKKIKYQSYDIIGEPYFDLDYQKVAYLTDTGRKWNANTESVRDKVDSIFSFNLSSTFDVIDAFRNDKFPPIIMINTHPQRWTDKKIHWLNELVFQSIKNLIKKSIPRKEN